MVNKKRLILGVAVILILLVAIFVFFRFFLVEEVQLTKTSLIKLNIPIKGELNSSIKISNPYKETQDFKIYLNDFQGLINLEESEFSLNPKEEKNINVFFKDERGEAGIYVGKLTLESISKETIPVILGVEDPNHAFAIIQNSIPKYDDVYPGGKLGIEIKVYDLIGANIPSVDSTFIVKNLEGDILDTRHGTLIVGGGSKTELFEIPLKWDYGDYVLITLIEYKGTLSSSAHLFTISPKPEKGVFENFRVFMIIILIFVLAIFSLVLYFIKTRDELVLQLRKQQSSELKKALNSIRESRKKVSELKERQEKKEEKLKELDNLKKNVRKVVKEKHKKQKKELKKIKKTKKKSALERQLDKWKKQGYELPVEREAKKISGENISKELKNLKKQGYDISFLK